MKITDNSTTKNEKFSAIKKGSVFKFYNKTFLKTNTMADEEIWMPINAIDLESGDGVFFLAETTVTVVNCELIIK